MKPDPTLSLLIERAQSEQDSAARRLGEAHAQLAQQQQKLGTLQGFRSEYAARQAQQASRGMGVAELVNFRRFITQLDQGIGLQQQALQAAERAVAQARQRWQDAHRQLRSFEILVERRSTAALRVELRREQRDSDAFAQRKPAPGQGRALPGSTPK